MIIQERYLTICLQRNIKPLSSPNVWTDRERFLLWQALSDKVKNWLCQSASTEKHTGANFKGCRKASPKTMRSFSLLTFARSRASSDFGIGKQRTVLNLSILFKILYSLLFICYKLKLFSDYLLQFTKKPDKIKGSVKYPHLTVFIFFSYVESAYGLRNIIHILWITCG